MTFQSDLPCKTLVYKTTEEGLDIHANFWAPRSAETSAIGTVGKSKFPAIVYFHGGGFAVGARDMWIPPWLFKRFTDRGYVFISADYRLLPSCTAYDIIEDVKALWALITREGFEVSFDSGTSELAGEKTLKLEIDAKRIVVAGSSAGGLIAKLAVMHCKDPRPSGLIDIYGVGGQIFSSYYLSTKSAAFTTQSFKWLEKKDFEEYTYPFPHGRPKIVANSYPEYAGPEHPLGPSYPANPRMQLVWLYLQHGEVLDYLTGQHEPSLSALLRSKLGLEQPRGTETHEVVYVTSPDKVKEAMNAIDQRHVQAIFPQFNVDAEWPRSAFLHGEGDTGVPLGDSANMQWLLEYEGVPARLFAVEQVEHAFDFDEDAESKWGDVFDGLVDFVLVPRESQ